MTDTDTTSAPAPAEAIEESSKGKRPTRRAATKEQRTVRTKAAEVGKARDGMPRFAYELVDGNGEVVAKSGHSFKSAEAAQRAGEARLSS